MSPIDVDLLAMMFDTVTIEPVVGTDKFNNLIYGVLVPDIPCQIVKENKRSLDRSGREVVSRVQIILGNPDLVVTPDDRLTLPDGSHPAIIQVLGAKDELGQPYWSEIHA